MSDMNWIKSQIPVGSRWRHYKGTLYVVVGHARREEDGSPVVLYRAVGDLNKWVRSVESWLGGVDIGNSASTARFRRE